MQLAPCIAARRLAACFLLLAFALSSCVSREAKSARFIETGKKMLKNKDTARAILQFQNAVKATPKNAEAYYQLGMAFLAARDVDQGIATLRKALEINPKHRNANLEMAKLRTITNDKGILHDAEEELREILQGTPDDPDALHTLALTELKLGDSEAAIRDLSHAMSAAPQEVLIAATLAQAKLSRGDVKGAEEVLKKAKQQAPSSVSAVVLLGRFYMTQNRMAEAEQQLRQAVAMDSKDSTALFNLAVVQIRSGRPTEAEGTLRILSKLPEPATKSALAVYFFQNGRKDEAVMEFERLAKEDPDDRMARTRLVTAYDAVGRRADAEKLLSAALKRNRSDLDALLQRGEILLAEGKFGEAEGDLNQVLHFQPSSPDVHYILSKLYKARGETLRYQQELTKALELNPLAITVRLELAHALTQARSAQAALDILDVAPASQKDSLIFLAARNWVLWAKGDMAEFRKGVDQGLSREKSTEFLLQDGMWKLRSGNATGARSSLEAALKIDPRDVRALSALHESYQVQKQTAMAVEKVKEYAAQSPKSAAVQDFLGTILLARGSTAAARSAFEAAKAADSRSREADLSLIQVDLVEGKLDHAQQQLQAFVSGNPGDVTARLWLANVEVTKGNYRTAVEQYRAVVAAEPDNAEALNNLAYGLSEDGGNPNEALKFAQKAKELAPNSPVYSDTLGWILYRQGLYPSAVKEIERATAKGGNAVWEYHLAMAYAKAGEQSRARVVLQSALKRNPRLPEAKLAHEVVEGVSLKGGGSR
jgi:tetratricopeptide (TPR) repeat protein